ncbi:MAG: VCBS repeat-containing protein [Azoarcus sp.]|jgi:hypothetical protein|nr:VCBS repeat-containing protein [Azoarcus sp.]
MKITQSQLSFSTSHLATKESRTQESFKFAKPNSNPTPGLNSAAPGKEGAASPVQISDAGRQNLQAEGTRRTSNPSRQTDSDPKLTLLRMAIEMFTGKKVNVCDAELRDPQSAAGNGGGIGMSYERHSSYTETEMSSFSAQGMVRTADGMEINFQLDLTMFRAYHAEEHVEFSMGALQDPLVLNFAGTAAELSDMTFKFDLLGNGREVDMRALQPGSGFLVFDRNGDGKVNDGRELFGATTGNGFAELAALDDDGNGWIDENDRAFSSLYIWSKNADGNDVLTSLKDAGVGALALSYANTPFSLKDANNKLLGQITDTSVFLMEKGGVGTVQKVDVVV